MNDCLFCKIASGEIPSKKIAESDDIYAFEDVNPQAPTHILLIPKKHVPSNLELVDGDKKVVGQIFLMANEIAAQLGIDQTGFRVVTNCGANAGQAVSHIHFHLLGGREMSWPPG